MSITKRAYYIRTTIVNNKNNETIKISFKIIKLQKAPRTYVRINFKISKPSQRLSLKAVLLLQNFRVNLFIFHLHLNDHITLMKLSKKNIKYFQKYLEFYQIL